MTARLLIAACALACALAPPASAQVTMTEHRVTMRDGVEIAVDLYTPQVEAGVKLPVIVSFTPYHVLYKALGPSLSEGYRFTGQGYAFALADVRGTYESGGCWDYGGLHERQDGYDLVEWLGTQEWSNGKVGMIGNSYDGTTANGAAVEQPPHLATIVPISAISRWYGYAYTQGVRHTTSGEDADIDPPGVTPLDFQTAYGFLPPPEPGTVTSAQQVAMRWQPCDRLDQFLRGYETEPDFDEFWKERDYLRLADRVKVPALVSHGLQDYNVKTWEGTQFFEALPGEKMMIVGQWAHASPTWPEWSELLDRWFARWLKGEPNGVENEPALIVEGVDREYTRREQWAGGGRVVATLGEGDVDYFDDGALTESEMLRGGAGSRAVRVALPSLTGVHVMGRPRVRLRATSDQPSTHFVAVLLDVAPDGSSDVVSRGFLNGRYRRGLETGADIEPGRPDTFEIELMDKDHRLADDHHLELIVASSSTTWVMSDDNRATNTLHLAESELVLPVPGGAPAPAPTAGRPATPPAARRRPCRRRSAYVRMPRGRLRSLSVKVNGRRVRITRRGRRVTVRLPRTRTGRAIIRAVAVGHRGRRVTVTRRVRTCRL